MVTLTRCFPAFPSPAAGAKKARPLKLGKDPNVATDFLPDKDREQQEEQLRKQLAKVHTAAWGGLIYA